MTAPTLEAERAAPELASCPFCGSATADAMENQTYGGYMVMCNDCTAEGGLRETRAEAIDSWSRRTAAPVATDVALPPLDAEGLPPLPQRTKFYPDRFGYALAYTSEQVRRAQREAVAADRRARESDMLSDEWKGGYSAGFEAAKHLLSSSSAAAQTIDTPEFRTLVEWWAGAAHSSDKHTRTVRAKAEWAKLIAYIDGRTAGTAVPEHLREFVEAVAGPCFNYIDRETDKNCCAGCNQPEKFVGIGEPFQEQHTDDCIVLRARAALAAAPSHSPAEEDK